MVFVRRTSSGWRDRFRRYRVLVDDVEVGRLGRGELGRFELPRGPHLLVVAIDRKRSRGYDVSGDANDQPAFRCGPRRGVAVVDVLKRAEDSWLFLELDGS